MDTTSIALALLLSFAGCAGFYLASPHQRWRAKTLPGRPARAVSLLLSLAGLLLFMRALDAVPALFTFVTCNMVQLVALPYSGALITARRGE